MRGAYWIPIVTALLALPLGSCSDDDPVKPKEPAYLTLLADGPRDNVLHNLQRAYNDRYIERYDELLDDGFILFFSEDDVRYGYVTVEYWGRADEMRATRNMFDPNYANPAQEPVQDIDLLLAYPEGDDQWTPIAPEDQVTYPGETWYRKIVTYNLTVKLPGDFQYVSDGKQATFVLRAADRDGVQKWQIVVWRDDTGTSFRRASRAGEAAATAAEMSWGRIRELYSE